MEYKHQHLLKRLSTHAEEFRTVGTMLNDNRSRVMDEWRRAFYGFFEGTVEADHQVIELAENIIEKIIATLSDWDSRRQLAGSMRMGEALAALGMSIDDVILAYHLLQEIIRRLIRENATTDYADLWEAMDDYHCHSLAVLTKAFVEASGRLNRSLEEEGLDEFNAQLDMARSIQGRLIPESFQNHFLQANSRLKPIDVIGGDIFYLNGVSDRLAFFAIADAEGHGLPAALNMMALSAHFQTALSNYYTPEYVAQYLNLVIGRGGSGIPPTSGIFLTIHGGTGELHLVNAGHPNPLIIRGDDGTLEWVERGNLVLGLSSKEKYKAQTLTFNPGDKLILFTDGLIDFKFPEGHLMGLQRLEKFFAIHGKLGGDELLDELMSWLSMEERRGGRPTDDILAVVIEGIKVDWKSMLIPNIDIPSAKEKILLELKALGLPHDTVSDLHVVMDELLDNALTHGHDMDDKLEIKIDYLVSPEVFRIRVTDSGEGFDWQGYDSLMDKEKIITPSGRGLYFINSLMDEVLFNEKGNEVTAVKRFDPN